MSRADEELALQEEYRVQQADELAGIVAGLLGQSMLGPVGEVYFKESYVVRTRSLKSLVVVPVRIGNLHFALSVFHPRVVSLGSCMRTCEQCRRLQKMDLGQTICVPCGMSGVFPGGGS
jgi:hypothetical protein